MEDLFDAGILAFALQAPPLTAAFDPAEAAAMGEFAFALLHKAEAAQRADAAPGLAA